MERSGAHEEPASSMECHLPQVVARRVPRWTAIAFALIAAACTSVSFEPEPLSLPAGPIDVHDAARLAVANHPDARIARENLTRADALTADARAALWPDVAVGAEYSRTDRPSQAFGTILDRGDFDAGLDFDDPGVRSNLRPSIAGGLVLYDGGRRRARIDAARAEGAASVADAHAVASVLALAATRAWFDVHASERLAELASERARLADRTLAVARDEAELGARLARDVDELEVAVEREHELLAAAHDHVSRARAALAVLLGLGVEQELELSPHDAGSAPLADALALELRALLDEARFARPELVAAQARIEAALAHVREAEAGYAPNLSIDAAFGFDGADSDLERSNWMFGADLVANVTAMLRTPQRVRAAVADLAVAHAEARRVLLDVEAEVHAARLDLVRAQRIVSVAERAFERASDEYIRVRAEFAAGAARELDHERSRILELAARTDLEVARLGLAAAHLALEHALGRFAAPLEPQR
jgi:outer membrane protein TolC